MTAKTTSERQATFKQRRAEQGLYEVRGLYARKADHEKIKAYAKKVTLGACVPRNGMVK